MNLFQGSISKFGGELFHISVAQPQFTREQAVTLLHTLMQSMHRMEASFSKHSRSAPSMSRDDFAGRYAAAKLSSSLSAFSVVDPSQRETAYFNASKSAVRSMFFPTEVPIEQVEEFEADFSQDRPGDFSSESLATEIAIVTAANIKTPAQAQVVFQQVSANLPAIQQNLNAQGIKTTNNVAAILTKLALVFTQLFPGFVTPSAFDGQLFKAIDTSVSAAKAPFVMLPIKDDDTSKVGKDSSSAEFLKLEAKAQEVKFERRKEEDAAIVKSAAKSIEHRDYLKSLGVVG